MQARGGLGSVPVLVTGASGLLGTWLRRTAPAWATVLAATRMRPLEGVRVVHGDLRRQEDADEVVRVTQPQVIIHAAYARDHASIVEATRKLLEAGDQVAARFLLVSTDAVFAGDGGPRDEDDPPDPVWDYGRWKTEAEQAVAGRAGGVIVRLPLLLSLAPSDAATRRIAEGAVAGRDVGWYAGERRQPALASEVARALWSILEIPATEVSGVWHLAGPERLTRRELGARVAAALQVRDPGIEVPPPAPDERPRDLYLSDRRARERIAWDPSPVTPETLRRLG